MFRRSTRFFALAAVMAAGVVGGVAARPAQAHSELLRTIPAYGDKVAAAEEFVLTYDDRVDLHGSSAEIYGAGGKRVHAGQLAFRGTDRKVVAVPLPDLEPGGYRFVWFLTGDDGHIEGGEVVFAVDPDAPAATEVAAPATAPAAGPPVAGPAAPAVPGRNFARFAPATPTTIGGVNQTQSYADLVAGYGPGSVGRLPDAAEPLPGEDDANGEVAAAGIVSPLRLRSAGLAAVSSATRFVGFAGLAVLAGGIAFIALLWPAGAALARTRRLLWAGLAGSLLATALTFGLTGAGLRRLGPLDALRPSVAGTILGSHMGGVLSARLVFLLLAAPALALLAVDPERMARSRLWRAGALATAAGAVGTFALTGHSYSEGGAATAAAVVHMVAVFGWLGGLVFLVAVVLPRRRGDEVVRLVPAFSSLAMTAVAAMVVSGTALLVLISPDLGELLGSGYGRFLALKLALVAVLLLAASKARSFTQKVLLARSTAGGVVRLSPLVMACTVEVALALGVLSATAVLVGLGPADMKGSLMKSRPALVIAALAVAGGLLPLRGASAEDHLIAMKGLSFIPEEIQIPVGDSLTWVNQDTDKHDPAAETGEFDAPRPLETGEKFSHRFDQPGTVPYFCKVHTYMRGTITVGDGQRPEGAPPPRPVTTRPDPATTTTQGFPPSVVPYPSAVTPP